MPKRSKTKSKSKTKSRRTKSIQSRPSKGASKKSSKKISKKSSLKRHSKKHVTHHKKVSSQQAKAIGVQLGIDFTVFNLEQFRYGMGIELEHGYVSKKTNVTNDDLLKTGKIALAHILEYPDYYARLKKLESDAEKYWKNKKKPTILK